MDFRDISTTILPRNYPRSLSLEPSERLCEIHNIDIKTPSESALYARNKNHVSEGIADFPGKIYIRDRLSAMDYALNELKRHWKEKGRVVFWVDASAPKEDIAGIGVVYKEYPDDHSAKWIMNGFHIARRMKSDAAETLATMQAMTIVYERIQYDNACTIPSIAVIYSDSQNALTKVLSFQPEDGFGLRPEIEGVVWQAHALKLLGIQIQLH